MFPGTDVLIERIHDDKDRRKQYIRLSKDGQIMANEAFACIQSRFLDGIQNVSKEDLEKIECALDIL